MEIRPQAKQEEFLSSSADIAIFGGAAFSGKSWSLLLEPLRHIATPKFSAVIFRRSYPQVAAEGGLWDTSERIYPGLRARPKKGNLEWEFSSGATVRFSHLQDDTTIYDWDGAQVPLIEFDQLEQFSAKQFFYMASKVNRSMLGSIKPYIRAACNPDPECFLRSFLSWWIDDDGWPIQERSGVLRYFQMVNDGVVWFDEPKTEARSVTFIPALLTDNPAGRKDDPGYEMRLEGLTYADRMRLKEGNWNARPAAGQFFNRSWFEIVPGAPADLVQVVRYWDRAATVPSSQNPDPDWTAGCKMGKDARGFHYVLDMRKDRLNPGGVETFIKNTASQDGPSVEIGLEQDPGQAGKMEAQYLARQLAGYRVRVIPKRKNKTTAAKPFSSQAEAGNVMLVRGDWNESFLKELAYFPEGSHDDQVDSSTGAFNMLSQALAWRPLRPTAPTPLENQERTIAFGRSSQEEKKEDGNSHWTRID